MNQNQAPAPMAKWLASVPQENVGTLYATVKSPFLPIYTEHKVEVWGQVCNGREHKDHVHRMLYNRFPLHGRGYTYVSWRAVPDNPDVNKHPRTGRVVEPKPYSGNLSE